MHCVYKSIKVKPTQVSLTTSYLFFRMSMIPFLPYPSLSAGLSRHNFLMREAAFLPIRRGNSMTSIPFRIILYVFMGSEPENGGLKKYNELLYILYHKLKRFLRLSNLSIFCGYMNTMCIVL